jgi:catechol 2,3-dioxygenase-like lactoylglutathione lyase family enzyme
VPKVHGPHHLAIQVRDLARAERFYAGTLGLAVVRRWPRDDGKGDRSIWVSTGGDEFIALEACEAERPPAGFHDPRAGLHLFALRILKSEREAWEAKLAAAEIEVVHRSRYTIYFLDPEGNRLGLSHFPDEA